jgi:hypothetical protein
MVEKTPLDSAAAVRSLVQEDGTASVRKRTLRFVEAKEAPSIEVARRIRGGKQFGLNLAETASD